MEGGGFRGSQRARRRWALVVSAVVLSAIVGSAVGMVYVLTRSAGPGTPRAAVPLTRGPALARQVAILGNGSMILDVPLMTMYSAPRLSVKGFATSVEVSFASFSAAPSSKFSFQWALQSKTDLPVRFVLEADSVGGALTPAFVAGPGNDFAVYPAGLCVFPCIAIREVTSTELVGNQGLISAKWEMKYTVGLMVQSREFGGSRWLQVNYVLRPLALSFGVSLPYANVTSPVPSDLIAVGDPVHLMYGPGVSWQYNLSVRDFPQAPTPSRHSLPMVILHAGSVGDLVAVLSSTFAWNSAGDDRLGLSGTDGVDVTLQFYVDNRFGSLLVRYG